MSNRTMSRMTAAGVAAVAGLAVLAPAVANAAAGPGPAAVTQSSVQQPAHLTVASYKAYLKKNWKKGGRETAVAFAKLTPARQAQFLRHLEDRKVYAAFLKQVKGNFELPLHVVDPYNKDVVFVTDVTAHVAKDKAGTLTVRFSVSERVFGIPVTTETITVKGATKGQDKSKKAVAIAKLQNVNAAVSITAGPTRAASKGVITRGSVTWTAKPQVQAFGKKKLVKDQDAAAAITKATRTFEASLSNE
ncbi:hypothetical protein AB0N17_03785 [Streptomyces sp. NPDC051133]|uniref:hypothetical protein n=1 Tax=Streptomyces sp. NPDC051133 TaxID=3155521 RepID=UPI00342D0032